MKDYATLGTHVLMRHKVATPRHGERASLTGVGRGRPGRPSVGWTPPTVIYNKMRAIDPAARELNALMVANVKRPLFLAAWNAWYARWLAFFEKYQHEFAKIGVLFYTDDLARMTEQYRSEFASFRATYVAERDEKGESLIPPTYPLPEPLPDPSSKPPGGEEEGFFARYFKLEIPWWVWAIGGAGAVVGGYYLYKTITRTAAETKAKQRALERALPALIGPELGHAAQAHASDPSRDPAGLLVPSQAYLASARDPEPSFDHDAETMTFRDAASSRKRLP